VLRVTQPFVGSLLLAIIDAGFGCSVYCTT
jgi:hypothetical protein